MKRSIVVDASVFISNFIEDDVGHRSSRRFFFEVKKRKIKIMIPITVFFEVLHAYFRASHDDIKTDALYQTMIDWNISKKLQIINLEASFLAHFGANHNMFDIKTADAIVAVTAYRFKYPLITWDKRLLIHACKHLTAFTPEEFSLPPA